MSGFLDNLERGVRIRMMLDDMRARKEARGQDRELRDAPVQYSPPEPQREFRDVHRVPADGVRPDGFQP